MKRPHFSRTVVMTDQPSERRRFHGRWIVDTPTFELPQPDTNPQLPSLEELCEMMHIQSSLSSSRALEILQRLQDGSYLTRSAAEQSAGRMLDAGEFR